MSVVPAVPAIEVGPEWILAGVLPPLRLRAIAAQRTVLLDARSSGVYSSQTLRHALDLLDAEQIDLELRRGPVVDDDDRPA